MINPAHTDIMKAIASSCHQLAYLTKRDNPSLPEPSFRMPSSNGNIFRVTGHLCGEFTGLRWIPRTKASDAELWCFLWSASLIWINGWVNNREAGDLRRYRIHYDVTVMWKSIVTLVFTKKVNRRLCCREAWRNVFNHSRTLWYYTGLSVAILPSTGQVSKLLEVCNTHSRDFETQKDFTISGLFY